MLWLLEISYMTNLERLDKHSDLHIQAAEPGRYNDT